MRSRSTSRKALLAFAAVTTLVAGCGDNDGGASVSLTEPADGATVAGGIALKMLAEEITIEPAGEAREGAGHFHVVADAGCIEAGEAIPRDADHVHFGQGQAEGKIYLEPGEHQLCLQAGDGTHAALDATDEITIDVGITSRDQWCQVVGEVDELFTATDTSDDEFAVKQASYETIRRLLAQLTGAMDQVDADARDGVATGLEFASAIAAALAGADTPAAAEQELEPLFETRADSADLAQPWILSNCGIDIDG
jgi:hypothetical protein